MAGEGILNISFEFAKKVGTRQLPELSKEYESTVKGLYVVGDLADAPVIKIALNQGYDVACRIAAKSDAKAGQDDVLAAERDEHGALHGPRAYPGDNGQLRQQFVVGKTAEHVLVQPAVGKPLGEVAECADLPP